MLVTFLFSLITLTLVGSHNLVTSLSNLITFCLSLVTFTRYGNDELVGGVSDFFVFYAVKEDCVGIVFKRTAYTTSGSGIGQ